MNQKSKGGTIVTSTGVAWSRPPGLGGRQPNCFHCAIKICVILEDWALTEGLTLHILSSKPEHEK